METTDILRHTAIAGSAGFVAAIAAATAAQPAAYDSTRDLVSGLAAQGAHQPWIMVTGFQLMAVALGAMALAIFQRLRSRSGRVAAVLVMVAAAAMSVAGLARFDCSLSDAACDARLEAGISTSGAIHGLSALFVFLPLIVTAFLLAVAVGRGRLRAVAIAAGTVALALTIGVEEAGGPVAGLLQRVDLAVLFGLPLLVVLATAPAHRRVEAVALAA